MLCLSRKLNEEIIIRHDGGERIVIKVIEMRNGKVRLGFTASDSYVIDRAELARAKIREPK